MSPASRSASAMSRRTRARPSMVPAETGKPTSAPAGRSSRRYARHFCASQLYLGGMDLIAIQATLGHAWIATTMNYVHVPGTHIEDAWISGQQRAAARLNLKGLFS